LAYRLEKWDHRGMEASAFWSIKELPGLLLYIDQVLEDDRIRKNGWKVEFEISDMLRPAQADRVRLALQIKLQLQGQRFSTLRESLQAVEGAEILLSHKTES